MGDKKVRDGKMRFILPKEIGAVDIYDDLEDSLFLKFFSNANRLNLYSFSY